VLMYVAPDHEPATIRSALRAAIADGAARNDGALNRR
jgi:hypothetical protein